jgi:catechol 2,3-dioxygenase-like lactoylglutathione lyase family enzyme
MAGNDIIGIHHIGLIVRDMEAALETYRSLGFAVGDAAYPALPAPGGAPAPSRSPTWARRRTS